jgi:alpha-1,3-glucosyltransferase
MISCVVFSLPAMVALVVKPTQKVFVCAFSCIAMTFFMFSYHVHEKSILVPLCMIPFISQFIGGNLVVDLVIGGCAGMYHLLCEDGQKMQYFVLLILYGVFANSFYVA